MGEDAGARRVVRFALRTSDEIVRTSALPPAGVTAAKMSLGFRPVENSLADLRMGAHPNGSRCLTCRGTLETCVGHHGHIALAVALPHYMFVRDLARLLRLSCLGCGKPRAPRSALRRDSNGTEVLDARIAAMPRTTLVARSLALHACAHCKAQLPASVVLNKTATGFDVKYHDPSATADAGVTLADRRKFWGRDRDTYNADEGADSTSSENEDEDTGDIDSDEGADAADAANAADAGDDAADADSDGQVRVPERAARGARARARAPAPAPAEPAQTGAVSAIVAALLGADVDAEAVEDLDARVAAERQRERERVFPRGGTIETQLVGATLKTVVDSLCAAWARATLLIEEPRALVMTAFEVAPPCVRPSLIASGSHDGSRSSDALTTMLVRIVKANEATRMHLNCGAPSPMIADDAARLQAAIAEFWDSSTSASARARGARHAGAPTHAESNLVNSIRQRVSGKGGRLRGNLMGKRVDHCARSVVTGDPLLDLDEVGVPYSIAYRLTRPERVTAFNEARLRRAVELGPRVAGGAAAVVLHWGTPRERRDRLDIDGMTPARRRAMARTLTSDHVVERHLLDGEGVIFNRQPSLHKFSMMRHRVRAMPCSTFRINLSVTTPYNADFDGDEMNLHVPQSLESDAELMVLAAVRELIMSAATNKPSMGLVQEGLTAPFLLTRRDVFLTRDEAMDLLTALAFSFAGADGSFDFAADRRDGGLRLPVPALLLPVERWTGKQIFSAALPHARFEALGLYANPLERYEARLACARDYSVEDAAPPAPPLSERQRAAAQRRLDTMDADDTSVLIVGGELLRGQVDKAVLGASNGSIVDALARRAPQLAADFIVDVQRLAQRYVDLRSFSIGVADIVPPRTRRADARAEVAQKIGTAMREVDAEIDAMRRGALPVNALEARAVTTLDGASHASTSVLVRSVARQNGIVTTAESGAKGSMINVTQIMACVGQQNVSGARVGSGFLERTLPHFQRYDLSARARGFVASSFYDGLDPDEFFFHAMGGREGCIDTAVKTAETGYLARRLVKYMEEYVVEHDGTVRDAAGNVLQFAYGEDGVDGARPMRQTLDLLRVGEALAGATPEARACMALTRAIAKKAERAQLDELRAAWRAATQAPRQRPATAAAALAALSAEERAVVAPYAFTHRDFDLVAASLHSNVRSAGREAEEEEEAEEDDDEEAAGTVDAEAVARLFCVLEGETVACVVAARVLAATYPGARAVVLPLNLAGAIAEARRRAAQRRRAAADPRDRKRRLRGAAVPQIVPLRHVIEARRALVERIFARQRVAAGSERDALAAAAAAADAAADADADGLVPLARAAGFSAAETHTLLGAALLSQLATRRVVCEYELDKDSFDDLIAHFDDSWQRAHVDPGEAVGVLAAQSISAPATQMTLNSVTWATEIVLLGDTGAVRLPIGSAIDLLLDDPAMRPYVQHIPENRTELLTFHEATALYVPSVDERGVASWQRVTAVTRHAPLGALVRIRTASGREVTVTRQKSLLVWRAGAAADGERGRLVEAEAAHVTIGDRVPVVASLGAPPSCVELRTLDVSRYLPPTEWLYSDQARRGIELFAARGNMAGDAWWQSTHGVHFTTPYSRYDALVAGFKTRFENDADSANLVLPMKPGRHETRVPACIPLDEEFGFFVGVYLASGKASKAYIKISKECPVVCQRIIALLTRWNITCNAVKEEYPDESGTAVFTLKIFTVTIAALFQRWLGTGVENKIMPIQAWGGPLEFARGLLDGYFCGRGVVDRRSGTLSMEACSARLIDGIAFLAARFDVFGRISLQPRHMARNLWRAPHVLAVCVFSVCGKWATRWAQRVSATAPSKRALLAEIGHAGPENIYTEENDVILDEIVEIESIDANLHPRVYDLTVPSTLNFVIGNGLGIRDTFHLAGQNAKGVTQGVPRIKEIVGLAKNVKTPYATMRVAGGGAPAAEAAAALAAALRHTRLRDVAARLDVNYVPDARHCAIDEDAAWVAAFFEYHYDIDDEDEQQQNCEFAVADMAPWVVRVVLDARRTHERLPRACARTLALQLRDAAARHCGERYRPTVMWNEALVERLEPIVVHVRLNARAGAPASASAYADVDEACALADALADVTLSGLEGVADTEALRVGSADLADGAPPPRHALRIHGAVALERLLEWCAEHAAEGADACEMTPNDPREVYRVLGIEACRAVLLREISAVLDSSNYVNARHLMMLVDTMTWRGEPTPVTRDGLAMLGRSPLMLASFEKQIPNFATAALQGLEDELRGVSARIITGQRVRVGTSMCDIVLDEEATALGEAESNPYVCALPELGGGAALGALGALGALDTFDALGALDVSDARDAGCGTTWFDTRDLLPCPASPSTYSLEPPLTPCAHTDFGHDFDVDASFAALDVASDAFAHDASTSTGMFASAAVSTATLASLWCDTLAPCPASPSGVSAPIWEADADADADADANADAADHMLVDEAEAALPNVAQNANVNANANGNGIIEAYDPRDPRLYEMSAEARHAGNGVVEDAYNPASALSPQLAQRLAMRNAYMATLK